MARPSTPGIEYYPKYNDFYNKITTKMIRKKFDYKGICIYEYLLFKIYSELGYYLNLNEETNIDVTEYFNISDDEYYELIEFFVEKEIFNKELYEKYNILSAKEIQRIYLAASKNKSTIEYCAEYLLVDLVSVIKSVTKSEKIRIIYNLDKTQMFIIDKALKENSDDYYGKSIKSALTPINPDLTEDNNSNGGVKSDLTPIKSDFMTQSKNKNKNKSESKREKNENSHTLKINNFIEEKLHNIRDKLGFLNNIQVENYLKDYELKQLIQILAEIEDRIETGSKYSTLTTTINKFLDAKYRKTG